MGKKKLKNTQNPKQNEGEMIQAPYRRQTARFGRLAPLPLSSQLGGLAVHTTLRKLPQWGPSRSVFCGAMKRIMGHTKCVKIQLCKIGVLHANYWSLVNYWPSGPAKLAPMGYYNVLTSSCSS